jgi:hypothetical protein
MQEEHESDAILSSDLKHSGLQSQAASCSDCMRTDSSHAIRHWMQQHPRLPARHASIHMPRRIATVWKPTTRLIEAHIRYMFTRETKDKKTHRDCRGSAFTFYIIISERAR